jgi:hypothetical protein
MASMTLDELVKQLRAGYGAALRAAVLYGSAATGEQGPGRSGYNVLVVVDRLGLPQLRAVAATAQAWGEAGHPPPLTLTTAEWLASADIFPMEYGDVLERHRVLFGELPLEGIAVSAADLRTQVEHQTLGKLLQLRQGILAAGGVAKRQLALLEASFSTLMVVFRGVARLHGRVPATDNEALIAEVSAAAGFDGTPFVRVARHVRGTERLVPEAAEGILGAYLDALGTLVGYIDRFAPQR